MNTPTGNPATHSVTDSTVNPNDPLAALRDIHLPEPISWWPPAPGWWLLAVTLILLVLLLWFGYRYYQRGAIKRAALNELKQIASHYREQPQQLLQQLSQLLRRVALATQPRNRVAGLSEEAWLAFLDHFTGQQQFTQGVGQVLLHGSYQKEIVDFEAEPLITLCGECIEMMFKRRSRNV